MTVLTVVDLSQKMSELKHQIDALADEKKDLQKQYDLIRFTLLPDAMEDEGVENIRVKGIGTVYLTDDINVSLVDKEQAYDWLGEHGFGDIIKPYVFPQTVKAFVKEQLSEGNDLPEGLFKVTPFTRAAIRPGT